MPQEQDYTSEIYNYLGTLDKTYQKEVSLDKFKESMKDKNYASDIHSWIGSKDKTFTKDVPFDDFYGSVNPKPAVPSFSTDMSNTNTLPVIKNSPLQANVAEVVVDKPVKTAKNTLLEKAVKENYSAPLEGVKQIDAFIEERKKPTALTMAKAINNKSQERVKVLTERVGLLKGIKDFQAQEPAMQEDIQNLSDLMQDVNQPIENRKAAQEQLKLYEEKFNQFEGAVNTYKGLVDKEKSIITDIHKDEDLRQKGLVNEYNSLTGFVDAIKSSTINTLAGTAGVFNTLGLSGDPENPDSDNNEQVQNEVRNNVKTIKEFGDSLVTQETPKDFQSVFSGEFSSKKLKYILAQGIGQTIPTVAAGFLGGAGGATITGAGLGFIESKDMFKTAGLNEKQSDWAALGLSIPLGVLEEWGISDIITKPIGKLILKETTEDVIKTLAKKELTNEAIFETVKKTLGEKIKEYSVDVAKAGWKEPLTEMEQAALSEAAKQGTEAITGKDSNANQTIAEYLKQTGTNIAEEGVYGLAGGAGMSAVTSAIQNRETPSAYERALELKNPELLQDFTSQLDEEVKSGRLTQEQAQTALDNVKKIQEADAKIPTTIKGAERRTVAAALVTKKEELKAEIEGKDDALATPIKEEIKLIDEKLISISKGEPIKELEPTPNTKFYQGVDFKAQTGLPNGDYTEEQVKAARENKLKEAGVTPAEIEKTINAEQEVIPATETPAAPISGVSGEVQESGDVKDKNIVVSKESIEAERKNELNDYSIQGDLIDAAFQDNAQKFTRLTNDPNDYSYKRPKEITYKGVVYEIGNTINDHFTVKNTQTGFETKKTDIYIYNVTDPKSLQYKDRQKELDEKITNINNKYDKKLADLPIEQPITTKQNDKENGTGVQSNIGEGKEPIKTQPIETTGGKKVEAGGNVQASEEEVVKPIAEQEAEKDGVVKGEVKQINKTDFDENGDLTDDGFSKATNILSGIINDVADKYNIPKDKLLEHYNIKNGKYRSSLKGILDMGENQDYQKTIKLVKDIAFEMFPDKIDELNNQINSHSDELLNSLENGKPFEVNKSIGKVISALNEIDANWNKNKAVEQSLKETPKAETTKVTPKEGDTSITKSARGTIQNMVFKDGQWQIKFGKDFTTVSSAVNQEAQDYFNEKNAPVAEVKEQAPVVKEQAAPPVKAEEKPTKEQKEPVKEQKNDALKDVESTTKALEGVDKNKLPLVRDIASDIQKDFEAFKKEEARLLDEKSKLSREGKDSIIKKTRYKKSEKYPDKYEFNTGSSITRKTEQQLIDDYYDSKIKKIKKDEPRQNVLDLYRENDREISTPKAIAEAYHKAKKDGTKPELVKAVEDLLSDSQQAPVIETPVIEAPKLEMPVVEETVTENEPTVEEEEEQYEPITVSDTSHEKFTKDNAVDYEEGEKEGDNGRSYTYLASVTVELIDDVSGEVIGTISKIKDDYGDVNWSAETNDGDQVADEVGSKSEAQQALVDKWNKDKLKEFNKEKAKAAKEKIKEAEKAKKKAEKEAAKAAEKAAKAAEKAKPVQTEKEKAKEKAKEALKERKTKKDEAVNITNKSSLEELENNNKNNQLKTKIIAQAKKAVLALKSILPNFDIYIHDTVEGYNEQMEEVNGVKNSVGNFAYSNIDGNYVGRIDINLNTANLRTVAHEVSHAVMLVAFGENPLLFKSFRNKISDILSTETNKKLTEFADRYRDNADVIDEEYLVELAAVLSETKGKMKLSTLSRIAIKVNEIVSKLTNGKIVVFDDIRNTNDIIEFFNSFSEGITKGADIKNIIKDYSGTLYEPTGLNIKGTISEPLPTTGRAPKSKASRGEFDLVPHPIIDKNMMVNKKYSVTMSDHTKVGEYKNDKTNVNIKNLMGGVFFPYIKGIRDAGLAWASVTTKAAREMVLNAANQDYTLIYRMARSTGSRGNVNFNEIAFAELTAPVNNGKVTEKELLKKLNDKLNTVSKGKQLGAGKYILDKLGVDTNETLTVNKTETVKEQNAKGKLVNKVKNILDKEGNNVLVEITKKEIPSLDALKIGLMKESFGKRGGFWSVVLKDSYSKKSTGEWYKFLEKYEVTSLEDIVNNLAEPEVDSAKDHDVVGAIKIAPPEYDERGNVKIYTTRKSLVNEAKGVYFIDAPDHPSYPYVVKGEPVGIFNEFNQITDYFPVISKWIKSKRLNSPYKAVETMGKELVETLDPTKVKLKSKSQIVEPTSDAWTPSLTEKEVNDVTNGAYTENLDKRELEGTAHATQVATTKGTYIKWANWLKDNMPNIKNARVLDVGAGFGHIHKPFKQILGIEAESYEPFYNKQKYLLHAGKAKPDYLKMDASDVPKGKFDVVVNNAVLNVVPADIRDKVVRVIGESIKKGGIGIISAMNFDYTKGQINKINEGKSKNIKLSDSEVFTYESGKYTYQKGFKTPEIVAYVQDVLGDDYVVSAAPSGLKQMATVLIKKIAETEPSKGMKSKAQVDVWHGSPYSFDKFTTEKIGTGEGAQAFGWGLYFTDLKDIAENYAKKLSQIFVDGKTLEDYLYDEGVKLYNIDFSKINSQSTKNNALNEIDRQIKENQKDIDYYENLIDEGVETGETQVQIDYYKYKLDNLIYNDKSLHDAYNAIFRSKKYEADENTRNLYKVSLHEGKTPDQYTWLEWDKPLSEKQKEKIINQIEKENSNPEKTPFTSSTSFLTEKINSTKKGGQLYAELTNLIYGDKNASEFLLRSGIDGIKYPAESIARGVTSDTARGSNYVVFDENAVTINTISKAQKNNQAENIDQDLVDTIIDIKAEGLLDDKDIIDTFTEDGEYSKEQVQAALDFIKEPTENEPAATITEEAEFIPNAKDIAAFEKILETTSGAIRNKNIAEAVKVNPKIQEIMDNFEELKKQLMASVELTEDCSW